MVVNLVLYSTGGLPFDRGADGWIVLMNCLFGEKERCGYVGNLHVKIGYKKVLLSTIDT